MPSKIQMTPEQEAWMIRHFKNTKNDEILARFGWSHSTMHRFARQLGLKKTRQFQEKCQRNAAKKAWASNLRNGTYPPKGFIIPNSEQYRFKPGHKEDPESQRKRLEKVHAKRNQTIKEDKARVKWGLPQLTKMKLVSQPRRVICQRCNLRKRGYHIERGSMVAYYDEHTNRSLIMENRKMGDRKYSAFIFKPLI